MFNFEDELIIQPGISWLIWIQLLVILLLFFLCCLTIFAIDFSKSSTADFNSTAAIASSSSTTRFLSHSAHNGKNILPNPNIRIGPNPPRNAQIGVDSVERFSMMLENLGGALQFNTGHGVRDIDHVADSQLLANSRIEIETCR
ncbi:uncharacterized protein E5676_scaffold299G002240 [Cucumis melo var. makuwa]|uniref:Uncharacterized protein n=1 Tax=Cucumis melo var. makuwa TaxID=1194695 RepID=A0A5D3CQL3_CUCMM|nr:uncharacterized protein E5676_scaffold299G002240 [Cucumis melo var. makuwa]